MNKKGQFFLVAALVIVALILSLRTVYNVAKVQNEDLRVSDLSKEISFEGAKVIDSGVYSGKTPADTQVYLEALIGNYSSDVLKSDIVAVYGNSTSTAVALEYQCTSPGTGSLAGTITKVGCTHGQVMPITSQRINRVDGKIKINISGVDQTFNLGENQNFYIIITKDNAEERFVSKR
jgi:hypothetical protein